MDFYQVLWAATEPVDFIWTTNMVLSKADAGTIVEIIDWLDEHRDENSSLPYPSFEVVIEDVDATIASKIRDCYTDLRAVAEDIAAQSRYNETDVIGEHYNGRCDVLDNLLV